MIVRPGHLEMAELLALRDGEGSAFARAHIESCASCEKELGRLNQIRAELRALPRYTAPRELWPRVAREWERRRRRRGIVQGIVGVAAAASVAGAFLLGGPAGEEPGDADPWRFDRTSEDLGPMISRSSELESLLRSHVSEYRVYDAPTALAVSALEDRILLLDRLLVESRAVGVERDVLVQLWDERVMTLEKLVGLRMAERRSEEVWR